MTMLSIEKFRILWLELLTRQLNSFLISYSRENSHLSISNPNENNLMYYPKEMSSIQNKRLLHIR